MVAILEDISHFTLRDAVPALEENHGHTADNYSEYLAYKWSVDHLHIASYPGARRHYEGGVNYYARNY